MQITRVFGVNYNWLCLVAGVKLNQSKLREMMLARVPECEQSEVVCYLLDDGGYIILSSEEEDDKAVMQSETYLFQSDLHWQITCSLWDGSVKIIFMFNYVQVGRFFDDIDPVLARKLFNTSVYSMEQEYDYQASCPVPNHKVNAGPRSFYIVSTNHNIQNYIFTCNVRPNENADW